MESGVACKEGVGSLPVKRKPEDEVQFVSSKPVKKCRGSRETPAESHRVTNTAAMSRAAVPTPGDAHPGISPSNVGPSLPASQPQHEPSTFNRGVSLPSMENYVFPPPDDGITSRTSRSSPMLSPKQLPQGAPSSQADSQVTAAVSSTPFNINNPKPPTWFDPSWATSGMPLQHVPMNLHMTTSQAMMPQCAQQSAAEPSAVVQEAKQQVRTSAKSADPVHCFEPATQLRKEMGADQTQNIHYSLPQENPGPTQSTQPSGTQKVWQPAQPAHRTPPGPIPRSQPSAQQHAGNSNGYAVAAVHPLPAKPPCFACEEMRQQALHNKANIYPLVGNGSHAHHGWHGPDMAHLTHPTHIQPAPFPTAGFGMSPDAPQGGHLHRPQHLYHGQVPMGYGMAHVSAQVPYSTPVQRAFPAADMSAGESAQGVKPHRLNHNAQLNASLEPTTLSQTERAQCAQGQYAPAQPLATPPSSTTAPSPIPPAAPKSRPPTPSPPEKHSPNLIVDIAETCEAMFPWDVVAERHSVPRQKVVDTFAAIIQLPLIRCTTDKKRHGRLATNRLKDFTRGKNAMGTSSTALPATPSAPAKSDSNGTHDSAAVLPSVLDLANSMAPVGFPSTLSKKYPGTW
ncbi:hypothetical protein Daus18300_002810 [Diaporthe australafricana]|uniref:Uncharacterized protein n=1 Tax=Diaporthe australafricana TaxID=127596 RepID=A0ABR3XLF7_9PEZI